MKVYIVKAEYDYEGFEIQGIYSSLPEAMRALDALKKQEVYKGDTQSVEEYVMSDKFDGTLLHT